MSWALGTPYAQDTRAAGVLSSGHRVPRMPFVPQDADSRSRFQILSQSYKCKMTMTNAPLNIVLYVLPLNVPRLRRGAQKRNYLEGAHYL